MRLYESLSYWVVDLGSLPPKHLKLFSVVWNEYRKNPDWTEFRNAWIKKLQVALVGVPKEEILDLPISRICHDLESRLGIEQGFVGRPDYRDVLREYIDDNFRSRYKFCKKFGLDQALLSRVVNRKGHFSPDVLQKIFGAEGLDYVPRKMPSLQDLVTA